MAAQDSGYGSRELLETADVDYAIRSQLMENTGRHFLDSGGAYGRHWQENQDAPPWEQPEFVVNDPWVTHNVYHFMHERLDRDGLAVSLEAALFAFGRSESQKTEAWLQTMQTFVEGLAQQEFTLDYLVDIGVPEELAEDVVGYQREVTVGHAPTWNTYNYEYHTLSQCLQGVAIGDLYAEYHMIQVHGGCDIRGGYTVTRVYYTRDVPVPGEFWLSEVNGDWGEAESCLHGDDSLIYQERVDIPDLIDEVVDRVGHDIGGHDAEEWAAYVAEEAKKNDRMQGAIFRVTEDSLDWVTVH